MRYKNIVVVACAVAMVFAAGIVSAQDTAAQASLPSQETQATAPAQAAQPAAEPAAPAATPAPAVSAAPEVKEIAIYGEVQAVDVANSSVTVQYYDYDTDEEKAITVTVGANAKLENASGVSDIKKGDWMDVVYTVDNGVNNAKAISVEKEEALAPEDDAAASSAAPAAKQ